MKKRLDYEFDLIISYIEGNFSYEERGWVLHFPKISKKWRKTIHITIISAQSSDNRVTVSTQQDPWWSV